MPSSPASPVEFHGYLVYPDGRIYRPERARTRKDGVVRRIAGGWQSTRIRRAPKGQGGGYEYVTLWVGNAPKNMLVHRLVAMCFVPNPVGRPHVNHIDGARGNNQAGNLEWVSPSENQRHAYRSGIRRYNGCTAETAVRIWEERNVKKRKLTDIAAEFGLSFQSISRIAKGGHHAIVT